MRINAKTGTINAILVGTEAKQGGISFAFKYPEWEHMRNMDKDQIFNAICEAHEDISEIKDMVHDIELTFTADPVPIDKSFKQAIEEVALKDAVIDVAVGLIDNHTGGKAEPGSIKSGLFEQAEEKLNKEAENE